MVKILVKKFEKNIKLPVYKTTGSSGMDLVAYNKNKITIHPDDLDMKNVIRKLGKHEVVINPYMGISHNLTITVNKN